MVFAHMYRIKRPEFSLDPFLVGKGTARWRHFQNFKEVGKFEKNYFRII
jgi:hypothetical protein